jgi:hypothetical protein
VTKARTKAQRRLQRGRRANLITLAGGDQISARKPQGHRADLTPQEPADLVALTVRARLTGCTVEDARDVLASEPMGRCIRALRSSAQDRRDLLGVWQSLCAAHANYAHRCLSLTTSAQSSSLPMLPDPMQTDPSLRVDLRTPDERDEAARRVWLEKLEALMALPPGQRHALRGHLQGYGADIWDTDRLRPTAAGQLAVEALAALHLAERG